MRRFIIIVVILAVLGAGAFFVLGGQEDGAASEETTAEVIDTISVDTGLDTVSAEGAVMPLQHANLSFAALGKQVAVTDIMVAVGDVVEVDRPLMRLESTDEELALSQADVALERARAGLALANAQLEAAQAALTTSEIRVTVAEAQLDLLLSPPLPEQISATLKAIDEAEANVNLASANRNVSLEINPSRIRAAEAQVAASIATLDSIQRRYDDIIDLCFDTPNGEVCPLYGTVEEATRAELNIAQTNLNSAQAALDELNAGATPAQRRAANAAVSLATANRDLVALNLDVLLAAQNQETVNVTTLAIEQARLGVTQAQDSITQAEAEVTQAEAAVAQAEAAREAAQVALDKLILNAPFAGTVADILVDVGEIAAGPVVVLADFSAWTVETTDLTELDVVGVEVGLPVEVRLDALPDDPIQGTVEDIASVSTLTRGDVTYAVTIRLEERQDLPIRWGMTAAVDIDTE